MALRAYSAIYDHGTLEWEADAPPTVRARVLVIILPEDTDTVIDQERDDWLAASAASFAAGYGEDEYEYTLDDVK